MNRDLRTATHLQEVVVLGFERKGDLLGRREHVREVFVGKLVKLLCMVCIVCKWGIRYYRSMLRFGRRTLRDDQRVALGQRADVKEGEDGVRLHKLEAWDLA